MYKIKSFRLSLFQIIFIMDRKNCRLFKNIMTIKRSNHAFIYFITLICSISFNSIKCHLKMKIRHNICFNKDMIPNRLKSKLYNTKHYVLNINRIVGILYFNIRLPTALLHSPPVTSVRVRKKKHEMHSNQLTYDMSLEFCE